MLHLIYVLWHRHSVFTPALRMLHLIYDLWHRHSVFTLALSIYTDTSHVTLDIWFMTPALNIYTGTRYLHRHLTCYTWCMIYGTGTWYMSYLSPDSDPRYMTHANPYSICFHVVQVYWLDIVTLDQTLPLLIPVLYDIFMTITFSGTWHDYYTITRYLVLLNSYTSQLLYTWTPEIGRLLTLLLILYSY